MDQDPVQQLRTAAAACVATSLLSQPDDRLVSDLDMVFECSRMIDAVLMHQIREVDSRGIPAAQHASSAVVWLRSRLRITAQEANRLLRGAKLLQAEPVLDEAMSSGQLSADQLEEIRKALDKLPRDLGPAVHSAAAAALAELAATLEPAGLRAVGGRILQHVAPEVADKIEEQQLRDAERTAHERRTFTLIPDGDGGVRVTGRLTSEAAAIVTAALDPLCAPDRVAHELAETGEVRTPGQRRADAMVDIFRLALAGGELPANGGDRPQVNVTVPYDVVAQQLGTGTLDTGERVSAEQVRQMACSARILPLVLGGAGQILDAGRDRRLVTGPLRRALNVRDSGCAFPSCDRPMRWCDAHHIRSWLDFGPTDLDNLVLLCGFHHRLMHRDSGWEIRMAADGRPEFLPPAWLDPNRTPRRNLYHHRE